MCGDCTAVCPIEVPSAFDAQLGTRKAIDRVYAQAAPNAAVILKRGRAACSSGCPIDTSVQAYVALIAAGKFEEAAEVIRRENPLPSVCGRVCFHPCELQVQPRRHRRTHQYPRTEAVRHGPVPCACPRPRKSRPRENRWPLSAPGLRD